MKSLIKLIILIVLMCAFSGVNAQFSGAGSQSDTITVSEIKKNARQLSWSDRIVNVKGFVVEQYSEDYFWFEDKTGRIKVEIEPNLMPDIPFNSSTEVVIIGEVCYPVFGRTYIGTKKIKFTGNKR
jgi:uncharacterized protein (TIGR00156 family)